MIVMASNSTLDFTFQVQLLLPHLRQSELRKVIFNPALVLAVAKRRVWDIVPVIENLKPSIFAGLRHTVRRHRSLYLKTVS